jgi:glutaredoxin-related protein
MMQTNKNIPEPTAIATPEYCGLTEFEATWLKIGSIFLKFKTQEQIFDEVADPNLQLGMHAEESIKLQRELDAVEVPESMTYLKKLLSDAISNSISAVAHQKKGSISLCMTLLEITETNLVLFAEEYERRWNFFHKSQTTIMQTQAVQPTKANTHGPTGTPEYCGLTEFEATWLKIKGIFLKFNEPEQFFAEVTDPTLQVGMLAEELIKLQRELGAIDVPEWMTYLKNLLSEAISNSISAAVYQKVGPISLGMTLLKMTETNLGLFVEEYKRLWNFFHKPQGAIMQTQAVQPTKTNTPEPIATPEYCGLTEFEEIGLKIKGIFLKLKAQAQIFAEAKGADLQTVMYAEELTKLQRELGAAEVPESMTYLKKLLSDAIVSSISALAYLKAGSFSLGITSLEMTMACIDSFTEEYERLWNFFHKPQAAIMRTEAVQPTKTNTPEPTATPEYCGLTEYAATWLKIVGICLKFKAQTKNLAEVKGTNLQIGMYAEELTKLQRELDAVEVPESMTYLKKLLSDAISNSISAAACEVAGFYFLKMRAMEMAETSLGLFERERLLPFLQTEP